MFETTRRGILFILTSLASTIYIALGKHYTGPGSFLYQLHAICEIFVNYAGRHLVPACLLIRGGGNSKQALLSTKQKTATF